LRSPGKHSRQAEQETGLSTTALWGHAFRSAWDADRFNFLVGAVLQMFTGLAPTVLVLASQILLRDITSAPNSRPHLGAVALPVAAIAIVTALAAAASVLNQQQQRLMGERVSNGVWRRVLDVAGHIEYSFFESPDFFNQLERIRNGAFTQQIAVTGALFGMIGGLISLVSLLVVLGAIAPLLIPVLLIGGLPSIILSRRISHLEFAYQRRSTGVYRARGYLRTTLTGRDEAKEIRVFAATSALQRVHDARTVEHEMLLSDHVRRRQRLAVLDVVVSAALLTLALGFVVWLLSRGEISLAAAAAAVLAVRFVSTSVAQLFRSVGGLLESAVYLADLDAFLRLRQLVGPPALGQLPPLRERLTIRGLSFQYPGAEKRVLDNIDFELRANEIVALVGENGSGKTTLAKLISGLYPPSQGTFFWDEIDVSSLDIAEVRSHISVIFQDFIRYKLTALENIGLGDPEHSGDMAEARRSASLAGAIRYLDALPNGLDTILSREFEGGSDLSMGQWQRVALARALRKPSSVVILDEPSASLDPQAEALLFSDIRSTLQGRAALLISHRFSSVRLADRIYVLEQGQIIETGTHAELVQSDGLYAEMFRVQASAYH
jgi:ATP-binding cassette subfamily B protein